MSDDFVDAPTPDAVPSAPPSAANSDVLPPFTLGTPIAVPGKPGKVDQIKVRKPTAGDILTVGNPVIFDPVSLMYLRIALSYASPKSSFCLRMAILASGLVVSR